MDYKSYNNDIFYMNYDRVAVNTTMPYFECTKKMKNVFEYFAFADIFC